MWTRCHEHTVILRWLSHISSKTFTHYVYRWLLNNAEKSGLLILSSVWNDVNGKGIIPKMQSHTSFFALDFYPMAVVICTTNCIDWPSSLFFIAVLYVFFMNIHPHSWCKRACQVEWFIQPQGKGTVHDVFLVFCWVVFFLPHLWRFGENVWPIIARLCFFFFLSGDPLAHTECHTLGQDQPTVAQWAEMMVGRVFPDQLRAFVSWWVPTLCLDSDTVSPV